MTSVLFETTSRPAGAARPRTRASRLAQAACLVGAAAAVTMTAIWFLAALTSDGDPFRHTGDYWFTGMGLPMTLAPLVLLPSLRVLQGGRDGRLGLAGIAVAGCAFLVFQALLSWGLVAGVASSWGPTYILATLASIVGVALFCAGSFRARVLPRWIFPVWAVVWTIGGMLGPKGSQLLLAAVYLTLAALLRRSEAA